MLRLSVEGKRANISGWDNRRLYEEHAKLSEQCRMMVARMDEIDAEYDRLGSFGTPSRFTEQFDALKSENTVLRINHREAREWSTAIDSEIKAREASLRAPGNSPVTPSYQAQQEFKEQLKKDREVAERNAVRGFPTDQLVAMRADLERKKEGYTADLKPILERIAYYKKQKNLASVRYALDDYHRCMESKTQHDDLLEANAVRLKAVNLELQLRKWTADKATYKN